MSYKPTDWRKATEPRHSYGWDGEGNARRRMICPLSSREADATLGGAFRSVTPVHDMWREMERRYPRDMHKGWYTNPHGESFVDGFGLCWGVVAYLGHGRWLAGYVLGGTDCGAYSLEIHDTEREAAREADSMAERIAEAEREYQQRWEEAQRIEDSIAEFTRRLQQAVALRNDKRPCFSGMREAARFAIEQIRKGRELLATDYKGVLS